MAAVWQDERMNFYRLVENTKEWTKLATEIDIESDEVMGSST